MASPERLQFATYWSQFRRQRQRQRFLLVRKHPSKRLIPYDELQACQRILCSHLEITADDSPPEIQSKLLNVSFDRFIGLLPRIHHLEAHLHPQVWTRRVYWSDRAIWSISFSRVLKVESPTDMDYLEKRLLVDMCVNHNTTDSVPLPDPWSRESRAVVNEVYQPDFERFGYEMK